MEISDGRIDQHIPIVQRNRLKQDKVIHLANTSSPRIPTPLPPSPIRRSPTPRAESPAERTLSSVDIQEYIPETVTEESDIVQTHSPLKVEKLKVLERDQPKLTIAIDVFGETLVAQCLSKNLSQRLGGIDSLQHEVKNYTKASQIKPGKFFKASSQVLLFLLKSPIWGVYQSACEKTITLFEGVAEKYSVSHKTLSETTKTIFSVILSRSGEPVQRVHNLSIETGIKMVKLPKLEELDVLDELLTSTITANEPQQRLL